MWHVLPRACRRLPDESESIVLRMTHESGEQKLLRGQLETDDDGTRVVTAETPSFAESGSGTVAVAVSFEAGKGARTPLH